MLLTHKKNEPSYFAAFPTVSSKGDTRIYLWCAVLSSGLGGSINLTGGGMLTVDDVNKRQTECCRQESDIFDKSGGIFTSSCDRNFGGIPQREVPFPRLAPRSSFTVRSQPILASWTQDAAQHARQNLGRGRRKSANIVSLVSHITNAVPVLRTPNC